MRGTKDEVRDTKKRQGYTTLDLDNKVNPAKQGMKKTAWVEKMEIEDASEKGRTKK